MRINFQERLQTLKSEVIVMGHMASDMVRDATDAVVQNNPALANQVIRQDDVVDAKERDTMMSAALLIMQESPVAGDLKLLVSTLATVSEIESVADHAVKLARRSLKLGASFPSHLKAELSTLSELARRQIAGALRLYAVYSPELAAELLGEEDAVDEAYGNAKRHVYDLIREESDDPATLVRVIETFHALEHVGDNAVSITKRVQFLHEPIE